VKVSRWVSAIGMRAIIATRDPISTLGKAAS
jgi:hypothetical protein